jgi:hypothetical protein
MLLSHSAPWEEALPDIIALQGTSILQTPPFDKVRLDRCPQENLGRLFKTIKPAEAQLLLERGARPGKAAEHALGNYNYSLLGVIRKFGHVRYGEPHYKAAAGSLLGMTQLLEQGGDPNAWVKRNDGKRMPLIFFIATETETGCHSHPEMVSLLLDHGANLSVPADSALSPLLVELFEHARCTTELLHKLIQRGANVNAPDGDGIRPLHVLLLANFWADESQAILEELLRLGAEVNVRDREGHTPLMLAGNLFKEGAADRVAALLRAGAHVNDCDRLRRTALHHLFLSFDLALSGLLDGQRECQSVLDLLLHAGVDIFAQDESGSYAETLGNCKRAPDERATVSRLRHRALWNVKAPTQLLPNTRPRP